MKYADTCGYDKDKLRPNAWPYRDYVIRSFNSDKPFARFIQEQVAGDAIYPNTADGIVGLGFIAAGPWDHIGHSEVPESKIDGKIARNLDRDDMLSNVFNSFCAVTIQCARCHEHKGDPITQEHYYSLQSIFAAVDKADRPYNVDPSISKRRIDLNAKLENLRKEKTHLESTIRKEAGPELAKLDSKIKALQPKLKPLSKRPEFGYHSQISKSPDTLKWVQVDLGERVDIQKIILHPCHDNHNNIGAGFGFPVRYKVIASNRQDFSRSQVLADQSKSDFPNPGLMPTAHEVRSSARYIRITATRLALRSNDYIFALAELEVLDALGENRALKAKVSSLDSIEAPNRWRKSNLTDGIWAKEGDPEASAEMARLNLQKTRFLEKYRTPKRKARLAEIQKSIKDSEDQLRNLPTGKMVYAAATEFKSRGNFKPTNGKPRVIKVLHRGEVTMPRAEVRPGTIPIFKDEPWQFDLEEGHDESARRAALAHWLTRKDHRLLGVSSPTESGNGILETD